MADLPSGTVSFLFTDIEGSTRLWEQYSQAMAGVIARHDAILRQATATHGGVVFRTAGDAFCTAFASAPQALRAALDAQRALASEIWGIVGTVPVRMALHTCAAAPEDGDYRTGALNRLGRLLGAVHGGQIVLSQSTADLSRDTLPSNVSLRDLGERHLRDLRPEPVFQLVAPDLPADFPPLKTLDHPHNLPEQPTALIGREQAIATVCALLQRADVHLVTLTGPGGMGKTRLALQTGGELLDDFNDGVWFVNLAPLSDPNLVATSIAQILAVRERDGRSLLDDLKDYLQPKQLLLLLDNFEQVVDAAPLVGKLLAAAPGLKVLATSRMPLHLSGEREYAVPPLGLPPVVARKVDAADSPTVDVHIRSSAAVRLFVERSQAVKADFAVTYANAPAIAKICAQLDGLPLAIELAAARIKLFPPQALLARLSSQLTLLTGGARDLPARQQTLRSTIDWSYNLLGAGEQTLFVRLGVFVTGCTLEAVEAVCNADGDLPIDIVDGITALLNQSLLRQDAALEGEPRFTMLATIREYALEQLKKNGAADALQQHHADYFLSMAEQAEPWLRFMRPERDQWMARLAVEHDNLRAALEWFSERGETEPSLRLAGALRVFWQQRFHWGEGRAWLEAALAKSGTMEGAARAKALVAAGHLAWSRGDSMARTYIEEGLALLRTVGDKAAIATALCYLANVTLGMGEYAMARACAEECLALFDEVSDQWGRPYALQTLGHIAAVQGDLTQAAAYTEEYLAVYRQSGYKRGIAIGLIDKGVIAQLQGNWEHAVAFYAEGLAILREGGDKQMTALVLHNLGGAVLHQGDVWRAAACFAEGLTLSQELGDQSSIAINLAGMAGVAAAQQPEHSARLFGAADALFDALAMIVEPVDRAEYDRNAAVARVQLGEDAFAAAWAAGQALTAEQAMAEALELRVAPK
jgi:predicted ATPase/class 3 adenylate cyclase